jgi:hypothetical protein
MSLSNKILKNSFYGIFSRSSFNLKLPKQFMRKASIDKIFKRDGWNIIRR